MRSELTPSSTVGPYFGMALTREGLERLVPDDTPGGLVLMGTVVDGQGRGVPEAMIEIWQANAEGSYEAASFGEGGFNGFGRCHTDDAGGYRFLTIKPGSVPAADRGDQAPHINMAIFGGGLVKPLRTRVYFGDETEANAADPVLAMVEEDRRSLLVASVDGNTVRFDIRLQGDGETPFFEV